MAQRPRSTPCTTAPSTAAGPHQSTRTAGVRADQPQQRRPELVAPLCSRCTKSLPGSKVFQVHKRSVDQKLLLVTESKDPLQLMRSSPLGTYTALLQADAAGSLLQHKSAPAQTSDPRGSLQMAENTQQPMSQGQGCIQQQVCANCMAQTFIC